MTLAVAGITSSLRDVPFQGRTQRGFVTRETRKIASKFYGFLGYEPPLGTALILGEQGAESIHVTLNCLQQRDLEENLAAKSVGP